MGDTANDLNHPGEAWENPYSETRGGDEEESDSQYNNDDDNNTIITMIY